MKKVIYFLAILFVIMLTGCKSCKPEPVITTDDLNGTWNFVSLVFNNDTIYNCDIILNQSYDLITLTLKDVSNTSMTLFTDCMDAGDAPLWEMEYLYTLSNDEITLENDVKFQIVNVSDFNGTILKLKLLSAPQTGLPINGIYILQK